jgi:hypothetical protein
MGLRGEIYSAKVSLANRSYFFNVKENRMGDLFMTLVESKPNEGEGFERREIVVFAEDLSDFLKGFEESLRFMEREHGRRMREGRGHGDGRDHGAKRGLEAEARPDAEFRARPKPFRDTSARHGEGGARAAYRARAKENHDPWRKQPATKTKPSQYRGGSAVSGGGSADNRGGSTGFRGKPAYGGKGQAKGGKHSGGGKPVPQKKAQGGKRARVRVIKPQE